MGKCLEEGNRDAVRKNLDKNPVEGVDGKAPDETILKILDKYGIRVNPSLIHGHSCANSVSVEIWGSGAPSREFLWSGEMADACVYLMERVNFTDLVRENPSSTGIHSRTPEVRNTHINIGTGKELTIKELAYLIKEKVGFKGELVFNASKPDGALRKLTDVSRLHALGWHHQIEIEEGVEKLYRWYLNNL